MHCGSPTYRPEFVGQIREMFADGSTVTQVAAEKLKISRRTYYEWKEKYPDFAAEADRGEDLALAYHERKLDDGAHGQIQNFQSAAKIFTMKARWRDVYADSAGEDKKSSQIEALISALADNE
jgi:rubrerythrin